MPGWDTIQSFGPADGSINAASVEAIRQQLNRPQPLSSLWIPVEAVIVADVFGATTALGETTVDLAAFGIIVPFNTAAVQYRILVAIISGASSTATINIFHKPGGASIVAISAHVGGGDSGGSVIADINSGRLTYSTAIGASPSYAYNIKVTGFLRAGALL